MDNKQSIFTSLQGIGIILSLVFINDIYNERWFDVGLMMVFITAVLIVVNKIHKIE